MEMLLSVRRKSAKCLMKEGEEWLARQQSLKGCLGQEGG